MGNAMDSRVLPAASSKKNKRIKSSNLSSILVILALTWLVSSNFLESAFAQEDDNDTATSSGLSGGTSDDPSLHRKPSDDGANGHYYELLLFGEDPASYAPVTPRAAPTDEPKDSPTEALTAAAEPTSSPTGAPSLAPIASTPTGTASPAPESPTAMSTGVAVSPTARPSLAPTSVPSTITYSGQLPNDDIRTVACATCGIEAAEEPFNLITFRNNLEEFATNFTNNFEAVAEQEDFYRDQLNNFNNVVAKQLQRIDDFICLNEQKATPPVLPPSSACPAETFFTEIAAARTTVDDVKFIENMVVESDTRSKFTVS